MKQWILKITFFTDAKKYSHSIARNLWKKNDRKIECARRITKNLVLRTWLFFISLSMHFICKNWNSNPLWSPYQQIESYFVLLKTSYNNDHQNIQWFWLEISEVCKNSYSNVTENRFSRQNCSVAKIASIGIAWKIVWHKLPIFDELKIYMSIDVYNDGNFKRNNVLWFI